MVDRDSQIVDPDFMLREIQRFGEQQGPIRMAHDARRPIGKAIQADGLFVKSMIVDKQARKMLALGVLTSYSIGLGRPVIKADPRAPGGRITDGELIEISLVDSPSNPQCGVQLVAKGADGLPRFTGKAFGRPAVTKKKKKKKRPLVMCTKCGLEGDPGERFCSGCGHESPAWTPLADAKLPMNRKGSTLKTRTRKQQKRTRRLIAKELNVAILTKSAGAGVVVHNRGEAIRAMLRADLVGPDPGKRAAAAGALRNLGAL